MKPHLEPESLTTTLAPRWRAYPAYKDSGLDWWGEVPVHWEVGRLGQVTKAFISGGTPSTEQSGLWDGSVPWTTSALITKEATTLDHAQRFITEHGLAQSASHLVPKGNLLVGTRVGVGKAAVNLLDIAISQDLTGVVLNQSQVLATYAAYQFKIGQVEAFFDGRKRGATIKGISRLDLQRLPFFLPPLPEQQAIAAFLDRETAKLDALITKKEELIALLQEKRAAIISHAVTRGLDPAAPLKGSGVEWLGQIPARWQVVLLGGLCANNQGHIQTGPFGSQLHASDYTSAGIPVVNPTHLGFNTIIEDHLPFISTEDADRLSRHYLLEGDVLISRRGDFSRFSYITHKQAGWLCGTGCLLIRLHHPALDNYFFSVAMSTKSIQHYLALNSVGSTMPNLNTRILTEMPLPLPSIPEQKAIVAFLDDKTAKIDTLISKIREGIEKVQEERTALIAAAVTGKIDVREEGD